MRTGRAGQSLLKYGVRINRREKEKPMSQSTKPGTSPLVIGGAAAAIMAALAVIVLLVMPSLQEAAPAAQAGAATPVSGERVMLETTINETIAPVQYVERFVSGGESHVLVDVRTPEEFASGHIEGAINIPVQELQTRLTELPTGEPVVLYCRSGNRSAQAATILGAADFEQVFDLGGIIAWQSNGFSLVQ
jgi:phage shock protein E